MKAQFAMLRTGGVTNESLETILRFLQYPHPEVSWGFATAPPDADVVRARSTLASKFLQQTDCDVLVMLDYDCSLPFLGDLDALALKCHETKGIVGCVVPKKAFGQGFGCRFVDGEEYELFTDELVELGPGQYMGSAVTAYHREMFEKLMTSGIPYCAPQGLWPFFMPTIVELSSGDNDYLSEDWAICEYARRAGCKVHAYLRPQVLHHGRMAFSALDANDMVQP
jgi:hypothetical protein